MNLGKYKWKSRILLVSTTSYNDRIYLEAKKIYQDKIKDFHKRFVKLICKINKQEKSSIDLIGFDGKSKKKMNKLNYKTIFKIIDKSSKKLLLLDKNFITVFGDALNILKNTSGIFSGCFSRTLKNISSKN